MDIIIKKLTASVERTNPFDLPITLVDDDHRHGQINMLYFLNFNELIYEDIELGRRLDRISVPTYIHEIAHAETESVSGYTSNYLYKEIISIFLQNIALLELDKSKQLFKINELHRYQNLRGLIANLRTYHNGNPKKLTFIDALEASMRIISTHRADKLLTIYRNSSIVGKQKILRSVQEIFDGKIQIEDLLERNKVIERPKSKFIGFSR